MCRGLAGGLLFVARVALLACAGGLAFVVFVCLWWFELRAVRCRQGLRSPMKTNVERLVLLVARVRYRGRLWVPVLRTVCVLE